MINAPGLHVQLPEALLVQHPLTLVPVLSSAAQPGRLVKLFKEVLGLAGKHLVAGLTEVPHSELAGFVSSVVLFGFKRRTSEIALGIF